MTNESDGGAAGGTEVAIVGMAGRFAGAPDLERFWDALVAGTDLIARYGAEQLAGAGVAADLLDDPAYVRAAGALDGPGMFDAEFFGLTRAEAEATDPQQRLLLECSWQALERAGYAPGATPHRVGVFASTATTTYRLDRVAARVAADHTIHPLQAVIGNDVDMAPLRVSYKLDLRGPSIAVQTACSSSLVAVHVACQSLLTRECDMALAGGAAVRFLEPRGYRHEPGGILSRDGSCRPFDATASGTVVGDGVGVVVLKRLDDALADGDRVHAVILGSAVNNDGAAKAGFTAPSPAGQAAAISESLAVAGVDPGTVAYVEAHGTGTQLGDPIEVQALAEAFGEALPPGSCLLGSVKSNIGHLDAAAGVAGLIKAVLALEHRRIPPTLHYRAPNAALELDRTPFRVNAEAVPWPEAGHAPRAAVSSFGIGGTNAHVLLEAAPQRRRPEPAAATAQILPLSARTATALDSATRDLADHLRADAGAHLADVAYTLQVGRATFPHRRAVVCRDRAEAVRELDAAGRTAAAAPPVGAEPAVVFMFPGQASQYAGMGAELYDREPVFRAALDECAALLAPALDHDLRDVVFARTPDAARCLGETRYTQPAVFGIDYALARLLVSWGIRPAAMIGHSLGEFVAACLAGVLSLDDAVRVVAARGRLMQALAPGRMLSVALDADALRRELDGRVEIAAVNAPGACTVAGPERDVAALRRRLAERGLAVRELDSARAFHSAMVDEALPGLRAVMGTVALKAPAVPFVSNVSGTWITDAQATDPEYWVAHARSPVRFSDGVATVLRRDGHVLVEVGPGRSLATLARAQAGGSPARVFALLRRGRGPAADEHRSVLAGVAGLWRAGADVDWRVLHGHERRERVPLPTYPFERKDYVLPRATAGAAPPAGPSRRDPARWTYVPVWHRSATDPRRSLEPGDANWLLLDDGDGLGERLAAALEGRGCAVTVVGRGAAFEHRGDDRLVVDARRPGQMRALVEALRDAGRLPDRVVHAWSVTRRRRGDAAGDFALAQDLGLHAVVELAQALNELAADAPVRLDVLTNDLQAVNEAPVHLPERATVCGAATVLTQEFPALQARCVDVALPGDEAGWEQLTGQLVAELVHTQADGLAAYRHGRRWTRSFARTELADHDALAVPGRGYLVTGADGETGLMFAEHLAAAGARLVLVGDDDPPEPARWDPERVTFVRADLCDASEARRVVDLARDRLAGPWGVVHAVDVRGSGLVALKARDDLARVLAARVSSTLLLDEALRDQPVDVVLLVSSTTGILGGFGQVDNCAAAAFLDAYAHAATTAHRRVVSVDWGQWQWDDWAERQMPDLDEVRAQLERDRRELGVPVAEGMRVAGAIAASGLAQVVVSTVDFADAVAGQALLTPAAFLGSLQDSRGDPGTGGWDPATVWPDDDVARSVATVWRDVLGVSEFGPDDDFFDLGGNSLFAIQIASRLRQVHGDLPMSAIFEAPTVPALAAAIRAQQADAIGLDEFEALLAEVERMSPDEAKAMLEDDGA